MSSPPLTFTLALEAPAGRVFAALTEARHLALWFCDQAESEPHAGGALILRWTRAGASAQPFVARWTEFAPGAIASFEGGHAGYPGGRAGAVRFELERSPAGGTRLVVTHEIPEGPEHEPFLDSWRTAWPRALDRLAHYLSPDDASERS